MAETPNILKFIGNTPMVQVSSAFDTGLCKLFVKLESHNPGGSIKDRIALSMIERAESQGALKPGGTLVEATAGNTGLALALVGCLKGYRTILVVPDKMSREKVAHLQGLGAEVILTRSDVAKGHPEYYQDLAEKIASEIPGAHYINQFANPANPLAHETTTGPEIFEQTSGLVDAVVCGVGSGGTLTGLSRYFAKKKPSVEMVLADPVGSILTHFVRTGEVLTESGSWIVEGIGEDFIPSIADLSRVRKAYSISDRESLTTARELLKRDGLFGGSSSGTLVAAALQYCREQTSPKTVVTFICDTGAKYLSKMYNDYWMYDQGLLTRKPEGDLRDLISRRHSERAIVTLGIGDTLLTALSRMRMYDISQIPVLEGEKVVGLLDEFDLLQAVGEKKIDFKTPVSTVMTRSLKVLKPHDSLETVLGVLDSGMVAIVEDCGKFLGLVTRMDLLNYYRRKLS